ncbi:MAG: lipocalin family protein [Myxococcota bacterium]
MNTTTTNWRGIAVAAGVVAIGAIGITAWSRRRRPPLDTVSALDLDRYAGTWFEIARMPTAYERGCAAATAHYTVRDDGTVGVVNRCLRNGKVTSVRGKAWVPDAEVPGALRVAFGLVARGDYNVLALEDYRYALVGARDRRQAWLLSRTTDLPDRVRARFERELERQGFDPRRLIEVDIPSVSLGDAVYLA